MDTKITMLSVNQPKTTEFMKTSRKCQATVKKGSSYTFPGRGSSEGEAGELTKRQEEPFEDEGHFVIFLLMMASHVNTNSKFSKLYSSLCISHTPSVLGLLVSRSRHNVQ